MNYTDEDKDLDKRRGKIELTGSLIRGKPALLKLIIGEGVVVHTEYNAMMDITTFWIYHPKFRVVPLGEIMPTYRVDITKPDVESPSYSEFGVSYAENIT